MSDLLTLDAELRTDKGKGASRRLRREEKVPAILYGSNQEAVALSLDHEKIVLAANTEAFYSHILTLNIDGKATQALLKDVQRHPYKPKFLHLDFLRIDASHAITTLIPLHFINDENNEAIKAGGVVAHQVTEVEVRCLPANLPEYIEVDLADLAMGESIHLTGLALPKDVELVALHKGADNDQSVVTITTPAAAPAEEEDAPAADSTDTPADDAE